MGGKELKAVAAYATSIVNVADSAKLGEYGRKLIPRLKENQLHLWGTGGDLTAGVLSGNLPTRNFRDAKFPSPKRMSSIL
jgi:aldehyde:ferredoxin oxidoreductase